MENAYGVGVVAVLDEAFDGGEEEDEVDLDSFLPHLRQHLPHPLRLVVRVPTALSSALLSRALSRVSRRAYLVRVV